MNKQKEEFRKWMLETFGRQDANDYTGTFTEEIAIKFADFKQKLNKHGVMPSLPSVHQCRYSKAMNQPYPRKCVDCGKPEGNGA